MEEIKQGDILRYDVGPHMGITRAVMYNGEMCMETNFMCGENFSIKKFLECSYYRLTRLSLVDLYKLCKKNGWETEKYIIRFGKNNL